MTSLTTSLNEAEDGLLATLLARQATPGSALADVPVDLGDPADGLMGQHVYIGDAATSDRTPEITGLTNASLEETFELHVVIFVQVAGNTYLETRDRAHALSEEVEAAVRGDPSLAGSVWDAWPSKLERDTGTIPDIGKAMEIVLTITARSQLP